MFFKAKTDKQVVEGAEFSRQRGHDWIEHATVIWVGKDFTGIPHVKFRITNPGAERKGEIRLLACSAFQEQYRPMAYS